MYKFSCRGDELPTSQISIGSYRPWPSTKNIWDDHLQLYYTEYIHLWKLSHLSRWPNKMTKRTELHQLKSGNRFIFKADSRPFHSWPCLGQTRCYVFFWATTWKCHQTQLEGTCTDVATALLTKCLLQHVTTYGEKHILWPLANPLWSQQWTNEIRAPRP